MLAMRQPVRHGGPRRTLVTDGLDGSGSREDQVDRQALAAIVHRPEDGDAAPGLVRRNRTRDLAVRIEFQIGRDLPPQPAEGKVE